MKNKNKLSAWFPGLFFIMTIFVFAPLEIYLSNQGEFWFSYRQILPVLIGIAVACAIISYAFLALLPPKGSLLVETLIYTFTVLLYIQGNYLTINHGTLNGEQIDWNANMLRYILNITAWMAVIVAAVALLHKFKEKLTSAMRVVASVIMVTQIITLGILGLTSASAKANDENAYLTKAGEFTVSSGNNTLVFLLDCFDAQLMMDVYEQQPELVEDIFKDFSLYRNTVGGATRTKYAIPFIFTGKTNTKDISYLDYLREAYKESLFFKQLHSGDYDARIYSNANFFSKEQDDVINNLSTGEAQVISKWGLAKDFMRLVGYRYAPNILERCFWMYSGDFEKWKSSDESGAYAVNDVMFYQELCEKGLSVASNRGCFRFYHLNGAHEPYTMNENCERIDVSEGNEIKQALGCFRIIKNYIEQLKNLGIYDKSTIVVMADHGFAEYSIVEQNPLFMVKLGGWNKAFSISDVSLSYASLPELFALWINGEMADPIQFSQEGERYFYQEDQISGINIYEYVVDGEAWDNESVHPTGVVYHSNSLITSHEYELGKTVYFDWQDTAINYIVSGFGKNQGDFTVTVESEALLSFDLLKWKGEDLKVDVQFFGNAVTYDHQPMIIYANDHLVSVFDVHLMDEGCSYVVPGDLVTDNTLNLKFEFPGAISPHELGQSTDERKQAIEFKSIVINAAKDNDGERVVPLYLYTPGTELRFGADNPSGVSYMMGETGKCESECTWINGNKAELLFVLDRDCRGIKLDLDCLVQSGAHQMRVTINNHFNVEYIIEGNESIEIDVPDEFLTGRAVFLCLELTDEALVQNVVSNDSMPEMFALKTMTIDAET